METSKFIKIYLKDIGYQLLIIYTKNAESEAATEEISKENHLTPKYVAKDTDLL